MVLRGTSFIPSLIQACILKPAKEIKSGQIDQEVVECAYNVLNHLTQYKGKDNAITTYAYDETGMRTAKTKNGETTRFYWARGLFSNETAWPRQAATVLNVQNSSNTVQGSPLFSFINVVPEMNENSEISGAAQRAQSATNTVVMP